MYKFTPFALLFALFGFQPAEAQQFSGNTVLSGSGIANSLSRPQRIKTKDLDGDGDLDILIASKNDNSVVWYENQGNRQFSKNVIDNNFSGVSDVDAADLDNDGDMDIVAVSESLDRIVYYQRFSPTFIGARQTISQAQDGPFLVEAVDRDGDGYPEVFVASSQDNKIAYYNNNQNFSFSTQRIVTLFVSGISDMAVADMDGNGYADVAIASGGDSRFGVVMDSLIGSNHSYRPYLELFGFANGASGVALGDFDASQTLDVVGSQGADDQVNWFQQISSSNFSREKNITTNADGASCVATGDLNRDGTIDVVYGEQNSGEISWNACDGLGNFGPDQIAATGFNNITDVAVADMDGDGSNDLLATAILGNRLEIIWNCVNRITLNETICQGQSYAFDGRNITTGGTYRDTLQNQAGCDSIVSLVLTVQGTQNTSRFESICSGGSIVFNGQTITQAGNFRDTLTNVNGCDSIITLIVSELDTLSVSLSLRNDTLFANTGGSGATIRWRRNGNSIAGVDTFYVLTGRPTGSYQAVASKTGFCNDTSNAIVVASLADQLALDAKVYPNPMTDQLQLELPEKGDYRVQLLDMQGKVLETWRLGRGEYRLATEALASGLYLLQIKEENSGRSFRKKLLKP